jgi:hypothetical protein
MRAQWDLQKLILARERALGITPLLPAFQGNVPWPLAAALADSNVTRAPAFTGPVVTGDNLFWYSPSFINRPFISCR